MKQEERNGVRDCRRGHALRTIGVFTLGTALGSIVALLYAPASGQVTRKRIGMKLRVLQRESARQIGRAGKQLSRSAEQLREATTERLSDAKAWVVNRFVNGHGEAARRPRRRALHHV